MATTKERRKEDNRKAKGRPQGAKTQKLPQAEAVPSACRCGSTEREPYFNKREVPINGVTPEGRTYNVVVWRRTRCKACGQQRDDKSFEFRNVPKPKRKRSA